jgi:4'-phosphopantetheinyl transferase
MSTPEAVTGGSPSATQIDDLPAGEVQVWRAHLDLEAGRLERLVDCLDRDELARAGRFHFERDRARFTAGRGLLRRILARYLDTAPRSVRFGYSRRGKPFLLPRGELYFNVSHAADQLVVAVSRNRRLGVDVEPVPSNVTVDSVAELVFSPAELTALQGIHATERCRLFAHLWTRKEAYIKADGRGMMLRLDYIDVGTLPDRVLLFHGASGHWAASRRWTLRTLEVDPLYVSCVAAEGEDWRLVCGDWSSDP